MPETIGTFGDVITAGVQLITDFGLMPFIMGGAVIGAGALLYRRFRSASR